MPREFTKVNLDIWNDPDFLALPPAPQHLYLMLWTSPALSYCGTHDWRPGRLAARSSGWSPEHIQAVADCLVARHFLVIDRDTEEVLVRSWARFDGLMKQPRMAVSFALAYAAVSSPTLRAVLAHELGKIRGDEPTLACWKDSRVAGLLDHPSVSAKGLTTPDDPFGDGFGSGLALGLPQTRDGVSPGVSPGPTTATTTTTSNSSTSADRSATKKRATKWSDSFAPSDTHHKIAEEEAVDIRREYLNFKDHALSKGATYVDWHAAFCKWLRNVHKYAPNNVRNLPTVRRDDQGEPILPPPNTKDWLK